MQSFALSFCAWILLSPAVGATPSQDFTTRGRDLLATKGKLPPPHDIEFEVDRYIVWRSQALSSKIGQLKMRKLRTSAEKKLGSRFDLRAFHDEVLENGALPTDIVETHIQEWVAKRKSG